MGEKLLAWLYYEIKDFEEYMDNNNYWIENEPEGILPEFLNYLKQFEPDVIEADYNEAIERL